MRLSDNRVPTHEEWMAAQSLGRSIIRTVDDREEIIRSRGLDRAFALPDANWGPDAHNEHLSAYRLMQTLDWNEVRYLRLRCPHFSGFSLLHMRGAEGLYPTEAVPDDLQLDPEPPLTVLHHWQALTRGMPRSRIFRPPNALGEIGWKINGGIFSYETCIYQERMTLLHKAGVLDRLAALGRPARILEIGAGYGALACALTAALPGCSYTICDLPESLLFSGLYLSLAGQRQVSLGKSKGGGWKWLSAFCKQPGKIELVPNYLFTDLVEGGERFDLVINVLSLSEMSHYQIETYGHGIARMIGTDGVFFEQNQDNRESPVFTYVPDVLSHILPWRADIEPGDIPLTQGPPRLWANRDPRLTPVLPTQPISSVLTPSPAET